MSTILHLPSQLDISKAAAHIATAHPDWQLCYLANHGAPVIGMMPKVSWQLTPSDTDKLLLSTLSRRASTDTNGFSCTYQKDTAPLSPDTAYRHLLTILTDYSRKQNHANRHRQPALNHQCTDSKSIAYTHGLMGFIGYDIAAHALNATIQLSDNQPACFFGHYDIYLTPAEGGFSLHILDDDMDLSAAQRLIDAIQQALNQTIATASALPLMPIWSQAEYTAAFKATQRYLYAGDAYQMNLTMPWQARVSQAHPALLAAHLPNLMQMSDADFGGYLQLDGFELLSVSPELFFSFKKADTGIDIITKPIKGTRPRSADKAEDERLKNALASSKKDLAENLMIVDLLRNDLGKYANTGKVSTPKRFAIESFYNVHHLVSTVQARMDERHHPLAVLFGSLPAGSITGAPKKRACEMINEIECQPRGAYCGSLGFLNFDGAGQFNVLIRTIQANRHADGQSVSVWAGGGITVASQMADEYQECHDKVGAIIRALADT